MPDEKRLSREFQALLFGNRLMFSVIGHLGQFVIKTRDR